MHPPLGVVNIQGTLVAGNNLVAHRQSNAGTSPWRTPYRTCTSRGAAQPGYGAVVRMVITTWSSSRAIAVSMLARAAVLGGVVQQVAEHLPQPLRVPAMGETVAVEVVEFNALPPEELPVGVDRILQFRLMSMGSTDRVKRPSWMRRTPAAPPPCWSAAALETMIPIPFFTSPASRTSPFMMVSAQPLIAVRGVRSSWDTDDINSFSSFRSG